MRNLCLTLLMAMALFAIGLACAITVRTAGTAYGWVAFLSAVIFVVSIAFTELLVGFDYHPNTHTTTGKMVLAGMFLASCLVPPTVGLFIRALQ